MHLTPTEFIDNAVYARGWVIDGIRYRPDGQMVDCDDYAWTLLSLIEGGQIGAVKALASGHAEMWCVKSPQNDAVPRHTALWHRDYGWIDSTFDWWRGEPWPHEKRWKRRLFTVVPLVLWGKAPVKLAVVGYAIWWNLRFWGWV